MSASLSQLIPAFRTAYREAQNDAAELIVIEVLTYRVNTLKRISMSANELIATRARPFLGQVGDQNTPRDSGSNATRAQSARSNK
jgi:hypothetical protein